MGSPDYGSSSQGAAALPDLDQDAALPWLEDPEPAVDQPGEACADWTGAA